MTLPPWRATNASERQAMIDFVVSELKADDARAEHQNQLNDYYAPMGAVAAFRSDLASAMASARLGHIGPLRKLVACINPELVDFISEPRRVRGQRRSNQRDVFADYAASQFADDVERVRRVWRKNYNGHWKRHSADGPSAEEIVAIYRSK
jgi:hypothetical protein